MIRILKYGEVAEEEIFSRSEEIFSVADIVTEIIENVKRNGDLAVLQ